VTGGSTATGSFYCWAKAYAEQLADGDYYTKLRPVVSVNFLNFPVFPPKMKAPLHTIFLPSCRNAPLVEPLSDMMLHFLDLPMFADAEKRYQKFIANEQLRSRIFW